MRARRGRLRCAPHHPLVEEGAPRLSRDPARRRPLTGFVTVAARPPQPAMDEGTPWPPALRTPPPAGRGRRPAPVTRPGSATAADRFRDGRCATSSISDG